MRGAGSSSLAHYLFRPPGVYVCRVWQLKQFLDKRPDCREGTGSIHLGKGIWAFRIEHAPCGGSAVGA